MKLYKVILIFISVNIYSQNNLLRIYPQVQALTTSGFYDFCDLNQIVKTSDGGYIISANPMSGNIHSAWPIDFITIKANSIYAPQWKQSRFVKSSVISSGRIITVSNSSNPGSAEISKTTNSGSIIWTRAINNPSTTLSHTIQINDMITYANKILCVGFYQWYDPVNPAQQNGNTGFTCELDTMGNLISEKLLQDPFPTTPFTINNIFNKVVRTPSGDFFIGGYNTMHKFNSAFSQVWGFLNDSLKYKFKDAHVLSNGDIFCLLDNFSLAYGDSSSVLLKLNSLGNILFSKKINLFASFKGMEKTSNGNFAITGILRKKSSVDTTKNIILMVDSNANLIWAKKQMQSIGISKALSVNNLLLYSSYNKNLMAQTCDLNGNFSCSSSSINVSFQNTTISYYNFYYDLINSTLATMVGTSYTNTTQNYKDTCGGFPFSLKENTHQIFKIFPNPTEGILKIVSENDNSDFIVKISSVEGAFLREIKLNNGLIDLTDENPGIYFLSFFRKGYLVESKKVIISR